MRCREKQLVNYRDLRWGKITPTDIDGFLDFGGNAFVCIEYKYGDTEIPFGQKLALERLVNTMSKPCILIHATHDCPPEENIDGANSKVVQTYHKGRWHLDGRRTVKQVVDYFRAKYSIS